MKVLMTTDTVGGVWTYAVDLIRALEAFDVNVALATMGKSFSRDQWNDVERLRNVEVFASEYKLEWMDDPWSDVYEAGEWLFAIEQKVMPDVVHLNGFVHAQWPFRAPKLVVAHSCVLSWWEAVMGEAAPSSWRRYQREVASGLAEASLVIAPTQAMMDALVRHYNVRTSTQVIPNGRDPMLYQPVTKEPLILAAGRLWDDAKNVRVLADVAPRLPWKVCLAGEQRHPSGGAFDADGVECLGHLCPQELAGWLGRASIYALPARYEPFGLSALEAALSGCALVLGDIPSLREVWGDAAVYVAPDNANALEAELWQLIDDPAGRRSLAQRSQERAHLYTTRRVATDYRAAYADLLDGIGGPVFAGHTATAAA